MQYLSHMRRVWYALRHLRRWCQFVAVATVALAATPSAAAIPMPTDPLGFVAVADQMLRDYAAQRSTPTPHLVSVAAGTTMPSPCPDAFGDRTQYDWSLDYCPTDNTVYVGQERLWDTYRQYGPGATVSGLAHEYGHVIQSATGVPAPATADDTIRHEEQADCVSGDVIAYLQDRGTPAELDDIQRYLTATASIEGPGRDHGTAEERIRSFTLGYDGGLPACSRFYPATPLD